MPKPDRIVTTFECTQCETSFDTVEALQNHLEIRNHTTVQNAVQEEYYTGKLPNQGTVEDFFFGDTPEKGAVKSEAMNGALKVVEFFPTDLEQRYDYTAFLGDIRQDLAHYIKKASKNKGEKVGVKWYTVCTVEFVKLDNPGSDDKDPEVTVTEGYLRSNTEVTLPDDTEDTLHDNIDLTFHQLAQNCLNYRFHEGTGWNLHEVKSLRLYLGRYRPLGGSQYVELPDYVKRTKGVLNIQNEDNKCFLWSVLAYLYPAEDNANRVTKYEPYANRVNMDGIKYPVTLKDIIKFEKINPSLSVNVFGLDDKERMYYYPLYISKNQSQDKDHINLLLIEKDGKSHYCLIKDLSRMLYILNKHKGKTHYCTNCLQPFSSKEILQKHKVLCLTNEPLTICMPTEKDMYMEFKSVDKMLKVPYVIYADFECILDPIDKGNETDQDRLQGRRHKKNNHKPCGYSFLLVSDVEGDEPSDIVTYTADVRNGVEGDLVLEHFFKDILLVSDKILERLKEKKKLYMTSENCAHYDSTDKCHICEEEIMDPREKVRDHCHLTGKYRGPAHKWCNLNYKIPKFIPVFFHNLEGYDSHLLMQKLGQFKDRQVKCIPKNMEKYISFSIGHIRFLDSLNFMNESLARLVTNLAANGDEHFHQIKRHFPDPKLRSLMLRKGVYPYEWMDSYDKMYYPCLPEKSAFHSTLTMEDISDADYKHAQNVWKTFNMKCMKDYHDLYLQTDVLLLADCFESFREKCIRFYKLDPAHFFTTPGLSWTAALRKTKVRLELLTDIDMHLMIEKGVRGGVSTIVNRYCKANNKYMPEELFNPNEKSVYMLDLDANNLYGWAMSQPLPTGDFQWISEDRLQKVQNEIMDISPNANYGYILEVDLEIPVEMHDYFNEYVPAPEHMSVKKEMLSDFSIYCLDKLNFKHAPGVKLIPNLYNKEKYIVHYRTLQCYLQLGLKLKKVHRGILFRQEPWLKKYIDFNTQQRKLAQNNFEKNFFKLMNNSVFGKTIENLRNRTNIELVHTEKRFTKLMSKPEVDSFQRFNDDLVAVRLRKKSLKMNRPNYAGMVILDLAKLLMYDFYYNVLKKRYCDNVHLLFTDTDSLCVSIETEDVYKDMVEMHHHLDCSEYSSDHFLYSTKNKKVLGKFKDEMNGALIHEYVGLRAKMYSILWEHGTVKTCKGINRAVNRLVLKHGMYKDCLFDTTYRVDTMVRIGSDAHNLFTFQGNKISLSPFDDKRYVLNDKITTLAYGHYLLVNN